jgi:FtsP/CotA-like multicopper oxidase with cupredoxin domain
VASSSTPAPTVIRCICTGTASRCVASAHRWPPLATAGNPASKSIRGIIQDVGLVDAQTQAEVEFAANNPGATLYHCHQQNHMDLGFMMRFNYA